jgi:peptide-methionine (S)-S-oxide reductase
MRTLLLLTFLLAACGSPAATAEETPAPTGPPGVAVSPTQGEHEVALLAGGCFWCLESAFDPVPGVISAVSGYAGGPEQHPTYKQVSSHKTGHAEVVRVVYDPKVITYEGILHLFWRNIDPFDGRGQFCDKGTQYRPAVFPMSPAQRAQAEADVAALSAKLGRPFAVTIEDDAVFWEAEAYHQDFWRTNEEHYLRYRRGCGRDKRLQEVWGAEAGGH